LLSAWDSLVKLTLSDLGGKPDALTLRSAWSVIALDRGDLKLGALLNHFDNAEISAYVEDRLAWSSMYTDELVDSNRAVTPKSGYRSQSPAGRSRTDETIENEGHRERPGDVSSRPGRAR
jgi:hypothetical protein